METVVLKTDPIRPDRDVIRRAAEILRAHGLVAFPTETVYGLGAVALFEDAVERIFIAKGRPRDNPLIIHISSVDMLEQIARDIPESAWRLINVFWPGPLTLVLPKRPDFPDKATGGLDKVAVRMPAHPVALELIKETGYPIAAPSANISGRPSPTRAEHVIRDLYGRIEAIIDAGETLYGIESTIVDLTARPPILLRPGAFPVEDIEKVLGEGIRVPPFARGLSEAPIALAPGTKYRHYAPEAKLILIEPDGGQQSISASIKEAVSILRKRYRKVCVIASRETYAQLEGEVDALFNVVGSRGDLYEIAKNIFGALRWLDEMGCEAAICEGFEERGLGLAVMNRLRKASTLRLKAGRLDELELQLISL